MKDIIKKKYYHTIILLLVAGIILTGCKQDTEEKLQEIQLEETKEIKEEPDAKTEPDSEEPQKEPVQKIFVYVCGAVHAPGVYEADSKTRVYEVIAMAGGLTEEAAADAVNQARVAADGEQIYVPTKEEAGTQMPGANPQTPGQESAGKQKVNLNTATKEDLMTLSGVGESKAESILAYREEKGRFQSTEELMQISGIKEGLYNKIKDDITV